MRGKGRWARYCKMSVLLLCVLVFTLILSGCWDKKELNQLALAQVIAIDYHDGQYQVTLELMIPVAENDTITGDNLWPMTGTGTSVGEAMQQIALMAPREIYLDHLDLVLLGEGLLSHSVAEGLEYLLHENVLRRRTRLLAVAGEAGKLLADGRDVAKMDIFYMDNLLKDQHRRVHGSDATINAYYLCSHNGPMEAMVIPRLVLEAENRLRLDGAALVQNDTLATWADHAWLSGYYWLVGGSEVMTLTYGGDDDANRARQIIVEIDKKPCSWQIVSEAPLQVQADLHGTIRIVSGYESWKDSTEADAVCRQIQAQVEAEALKQIQHTFAQSQAYGSDAYHLGRWLYGRHTALIRSDAWPEQFAALSVRFAIETAVEL